MRNVCAGLPENPIPYVIGKVLRQKNLERSSTFMFGNPRICHGTSVRGLSAFNIQNIYVFAPAVTPVRSGGLEPADKGACVQSARMTCFTACGLGIAYAMYGAEPSQFAEGPRHRIDGFRRMRTYTSGLKRSRTAESFVRHAAYQH